MGNFRRWILPNRIDGIVAISLTLIVISFVFDSSARAAANNAGMIESVAILFWIPFGIVAIALGAGLGWWCVGRWRLIFLALVAAGSLLLPSLYEYTSGQKLIHFESLQNRFFYGRTVSGNRHFGWTVWMCVFVVAAFFLVWLITLILRFLPNTIFRSFSRISKRVKSKFEMSRARVMVVLAVFLLVVGMVNNALLANGTNVFQNSSGGLSSLLEIAVAVGFFAIAFLGFVFWPSWAILKNRKAWIQLAAVTTLLIPLILYCIIREFRTGIEFPLAIELAAGTIGTVLFLATVFCLNKTQEHAVFPSTWSLPPLAVTALVFLSPQFVDYSEFVHYQPSQQKTLTERVEMALDSGRLMWNSNGMVTGSKGFYEFGVSTKTDANVLGLIDQNEKAYYLFFRNINPAIDLSWLKKKPVASVAFFGGTINADQLQSISSTATSIYFENVEIEKSTAKATLVSPSMVQMKYEKELQLGDFLAEIGEWKSTIPIYVLSKISESDWSEVLRLSQFRPFDLGGGLTEAFEPNWDPQSNPSAKNISVNLNPRYGHSRIDRKQMKFVLQSNVKIAPYSLFHHSQTFWDLVFYGAGGMDEQNILQQFMSTPRFRGEKGRQQWDKNHWVFGKNESGKFTDLFLPDGYNLNTFPDSKHVKRLSYDIAWLIDYGSLTSSTTVENLDHIRQLINLEELYFSDCQINPKLSLSFLSKLKKLKHLQIPPISRIPGMGLDQCQSLESITLLGKPDARTVAALASLPNLKQVEISDVLNDYKNPELAEEQLSKSLPGKRVVVIPIGKHQPRIPIEFTEHLIQTRKEIFGEYFETDKLNHGSTRNR